ncbi:hypothetical protein MVEG_12379 [Podila verticillata NRRL 6337]|uniref:Uncharacterized protein n=1 Tax=Podila verticillata NRRL 6337 TaxID=1069443 RepID=A0A086TIL9_9FUNG|nr:hypothetical protein MVEG_12379 [Podila verticillata NRRL 6337]
MLRSRFLKALTLSIFPNHVLSTHWWICSMHALLGDGWIAMVTHIIYFLLYTYTLFRGWGWDPSPKVELQPPMTLSKTQEVNKCFVDGIYVRAVFVLSPNKLAHCGCELLRYPF